MKADVDSIISEFGLEGRLRFRRFSGGLTTYLMVCVESANALENRVTVKKGATHTHAAVYSIESM